MHTLWNWLASIWNSGMRNVFEIIGIIATPCSIAWAVIKWINSHRPPIITRKHPSTRGVMLVFELSQHILQDVADNVKTQHNMQFLKASIFDAAPLASYGKFNITKGCFHSEYVKEYGKTILITTTKTEQNRLNVPLSDERTAARTVACFIAMLNEIASELKRAGVKDVHLFYSGPVCLACYISEMTKNSMTLFNYYRDRDMKHYVLLDKLSLEDQATENAA